MARVYVHAEELLRRSQTRSRPLMDWELTEFAKGFSQQEPLFDFIDAGSEVSVVMKLEGRWISAQIYECY